MAGKNKPEQRINRRLLNNAKRLEDTADTDLRLARYFNMSDGFFIGRQTDYKLMERRRAIGEKLKTIKQGQRNQANHIRNTPNFVFGIGAFSATEKHSASTRRVSEGAMMPSSHSRAVA